MNDFSFITAIIIFFTYVFIDILYALYIIYVEKREPIKAALSTSLIYCLLAYGVISYSSNPLYLIPLASGAFLGTYLVVRYKK